MAENGQFTLPEYHSQILQPYNLSKLMAVYKETVLRRFSDEDFACGPAFLNAMSARVQGLNHPDLLQSALMTTGVENADQLAAQLAEANTGVMTRIAQFSVMGLLSGYDTLAARPTKPSPGSIPYAVLESIRELHEPIQTYAELPERIQHVYGTAEIDGDGSLDKALRATTALPTTMNGYKMMTHMLRAYGEGSPTLFQN